MMLFSSMAVSAQISQGTILLGGDAYYSNSNSDYTEEERKGRNASFALSLGKAYRENKVIGINLRYSPYKQERLMESGQESQIISRNYEVGAFFRQYKMLARKFYFFGQAEAAYSTGKRTETFLASTDKTTHKQHGVMLAFSPGISYQLLNKIQVEMSIPGIIRAQYTATKSGTETQPENEKSNSFGVSSTLSNNNSYGLFTVGFRFLF